MCSVMLCNLYCGLVVLFIVLLARNGDDERRYTFLHRRLQIQCGVLMLFKSEILFSRFYGIYFCKVLFV